MDVVAWAASNDKIPGVFVHEDDCLPDDEPETSGRRSQRKRGQTDVSAATAPTTTQKSTAKERKKPETQKKAQKGSKTAKEVISLLHQNSDDDVPAKSGIMDTPKMDSESPPRKKGNNTPLKNKQLALAVPQEPDNALSFDADEDMPRASAVEKGGKSIAQGDSQLTDLVTSLQNQIKELQQKIPQQPPETSHQLQGSNQQQLSQNFTTFPSSMPANNPPTANWLQGQAGMYHSMYVEQKIRREVEFERYLRLQIEFDQKERDEKVRRAMAEYRQAENARENEAKNNYFSTMRF